MSNKPKENTVNSDDVNSTLKWILIACLVVVLILILACADVFITYCLTKDAGSQQATMDYPEYLQYNTVATDSSTVIIKTPETESVKLFDVSSICNSDVNNHLDKINAWLGFWIGVLAILGALLPFAIQITSFFSSRSEMKQMKEEAEASVSQNVVKVQSELDNAKALNNRLRYSLLLSSVLVAQENKIFNEAYSTESIKDNILFVDVLDAFKQVMDDFKESVDTQKDKALIESCLIQMYGFITRCALYNKTRMRNLDIAKDILRKTLATLEKTSSTPDIILSQLKECKESVCRALDN